MKLDCVAYFFLLFAFTRVSCGSIESVANEKQPNHFQQQLPPQNRKAQLMPFTNDLSTQSLQGMNPMQNSFNLFGGVHNPNVPTFSVDPMMTLSPGSLGNSLGNPMMGFPMGTPSAYSPPLYRNPQSVTHRSDDDLGFYNSLSQATNPELMVRQQCESIQRQAVSVANNLVKRQNKLIFKELMDYILKSKFLMGMTQVKINKALKEKFTFLMKKYTLLTEDNVKLISSPDDEMLDLDTDDLDEELKLPVRKRPEIDEEDEVEEDEPKVDGIADDDFMKLIDSLKSDNSSIVIDTKPNQPTTITVRKNDQSSIPTKVEPSVIPVNPVEPVNVPEKKEDKPWWKFWKKNMQFLKQ